MLFSLAEVRLKRGKVDQAVETLEEHLTMLNAAQEPDVAAVAQVTARLGSILGSLKRYDESVIRSITPQGPSGPPESSHHRQRARAAKPDSHQ